MVAKPTYAVRKAQLALQDSKVPKDNRDDQIRPGLQVRRVCKDSKARKEYKEPRAPKVPKVCKEPKV